MSYKDKKNRPPVSQNPVRQGDWFVFHNALYRFGVHVDLGFKNADEVREVHPQLRQALHERAREQDPFHVLVWSSQYVNRTTPFYVEVNASKRMVTIPQLGSIQPGQTPGKRTIPTGRVSDPSRIYNYRS